MNDTRISADCHIDLPRGPESSKYIQDQCGDLAAEITHKITCENAGKFHGLIT